MKKWKIFLTSTDIRWGRPLKIFPAWLFCFCFMVEEIWLYYHIKCKVFTCGKRDLSITAFSLITSHRHSLLVHIALVQTLHIIPLTSVAPYYATASPHSMICIPLVAFIHAILLLIQLFTRLVNLSNFLPIKEMNESAFLFLANV